MTLKQCGGMSIELRRGSGDSSESTAKRKKEQGYGYSCSLLWILLCIEVKLDVCNQYVEDYNNQELLYPTHQYKKNSTERIPLN